MKQEFKKCVWCGDKFTPSNNMQNACSMKCSFEHQNKKTKEKIKNKSK